MNAFVSRLAEFLAFAFVGASSPIEPVTSTPTCRFKGLLLSIVEVQRRAGDNLILVAEPQPSDGMVNAFDSENDFLDWARASPYSREIDRLQQRLSEARVSNPGAGPAIYPSDWCILYDGKFFTGTRMRFWWYKFPKLGGWPYYFGDKTSSAQVFVGGAMLFSDPWFRGWRLVLPGHGSYPDLSAYGFDNVTDSLIVNR